MMIYKKEARMKVKVALHGYKAAAVSRARGDKDEDSDVLFRVTKMDQGSRGHQRDSTC